MQLTLFTDFSLRVLIYVATHPEGVATVPEIARAYDIPRNHLIKVVNHLATTGFVNTSRGKGGGVKLARSPSLITIGAVVRKVEANMDLVKCFEERAKTSCPLLPSCLLRGALMQARDSFLATLDKITLADCLPADRTGLPAELVRIRGTSQKMHN